MATNQNSSAMLMLLEPTVARDWVKESGGTASDGARRAMETEAGELLQALRHGLEQGGDVDALDAPAWASLRDALEGLSRSRVAQGQTAADTSAFVLGLKRP